MEMRKLQEHFFLFLLLIVEWNCPTLARSPAKLELNLQNTDGSTQQVSDALQQFLAGGVDLSPSQSVVIDITPPSGSKDSFMQVIMQAAKTIVPKFIPNAGISFKLGASKSSTGYLSNVKLTVVIGEAVGGVGVGGDGGGSSGISSANKRTVNLDLSSQGQNPVQSLTQQVTMIMNELKPQLDDNQGVQIVLKITPPKGSTQQYSGNIMSSLKTVLQQLVPVSMQSSVKASMSSFNDGTIANMVVTITITPSGSDSGNNPSGENVQIDLSNPGVNIPEAVRTVLTTVVQHPTVMGNGNKPIQINLQIIPPSGSTTNSVQSIVQVVKSVLITLVPNAELSIKTSMSQGASGVVTNVMSSITIKPNSTQNPNQVNFNLDLSPTSSDVTQQITNILPDIKSQIKPIIDNGEPATLNLVITPPVGATDSVVKTLTDKIIPMIQTVLPNKMKVTANASKDPQGKISQIILIIVIQPDIEVYSIDLTKPGSSLVEEINNIIPNIKEDLEQDQPKNKPVTFSLNIQPPKGSNDQTVQDTMETVLTTLSKQFPNNKIGVQAKTTKDPMGNITNIRLIPTIEPDPNAQDPDDEVTLNVDLTQPGNNLIQEVTNIIPTIEEKVDEMEPENKPVKFNLNIDPPTGSTQSFVKPTINDVLSVLSRIFPNNQIDAKAKTQKDSQGRISNVSMTFTIQPNPNPNNPEDVYNINLEQPGTNMVEQITNLLPNLKDKVTREQPKGEPITFDLNIQPPKGADDQFPKDTMNLVTSELSKILPSNKIEVQAKISKDPQGNVSNVKLIVTVQPDPDAGTQTAPIEIDMSRPGSNMVEEITKILPNLKDKVGKEAPEDEPVSFNLNIQPPKGSNQQFVRDVANDVVKTVSKLFPHNKVTVRAKTTKDPQGIISNVSLLVTVSPKEKKPNKTEKITIDMTTPGSTVDQVITNILPKIQEKVTNEPEDEPVSFDLQIKPPKGTTNQGIDTMKKDLLETLITQFPKNKVGIQTKVTKDPNGNVENVDFVIKVHPKDPDSVKVNLKQPGSSLIQNIIDFVPILKSKIDKEHPKGHPVNFEVNIEPPTGSKDPFIKTTVNTMLTTLTKLFPNHKVGVRPQTTRDPQGNISNIKLVLNIEPNLIEPRGHVLVDLTKPGTNIESEILKILPNIETNVIEKEAEDEPVSFNLKVKPSKNIPDDEIKKITNTILKEISERFPNNRVNVKTRVCKEPDGSITDLDNIVSIEPNNVTGTTKKPKDQKVVNIDLSKPGKNIVSEITNILPNIKDDLDEKEPDGEPVDYNFKITPPKGTTDQTVKDLTQTIETTISQLFPQNKVTVKPLVTKDPQGNIKTVDLSLTIEPSTGTQNPFIEQVVTEGGTTKNPWDVIIPTRPTKTTTSSLITSEETYETTPSDLTSWTLSPREKTTVPIIGTSPSESEETYGTTPSDFTGWTSSPREKTTVPIIGTSPSESEEIYVTTPGTIDEEYTLKPEKVVEIDLSKPGNKVEDYVTSVVPSILPEAEKKLDQSEPVNLEFKVRPPKGVTTEDFVKSTTQSMIPILEKNFPNNKLTVTTKAKRDPQGNVVDVIFLVTVEPNEQQQPEKTNVDLDLQKPGTTLEELVDQRLPDVVTNVKDNFNKGKPTTIEFNIRPPQGAKEDYLQTTTQSLVPILKKEFPNNTIRIKTTAQKNPQGNLTNMTIQITVEPTEQQKPERENVDLDMSIPGKSLDNEVDKKLPQVKPNIENNLDQGKPVNLRFRIKPPTESTQEYLQEVTQSLVPILSKNFPSNGISVKTSAQKNPQGQITDMILDITIEPSDRQKPRHKDVTLDMSNPGQNLNDVVDNILPNVLPDITDNLDKGHPVSINFKVMPPKGSTDSYIQEVTQPLMPLLQKYFPNNQINVKTTAKKDPTGYLTEILMEVTVRPSEQQKPKEKRVDIDLSKPGVTLEKEVDNRLPQVVPGIKQELDNARPVTVNFNIKPPKKSTQQYLQQVTNSLIPILSKYFPNNQISLKTSADRDPQGYLIDMILEITILPSSQPGKVIVDVDLSKSGNTLTKEVDKVLPPVVNNVKDTLTNGKPVTLTFNVRPPNRSTQSYLNKLTNQLTPILAKYFPNNSMSIKTSAQKNSRGYISDITLVITIQPSSTGTLPDEKTIVLDLSVSGKTVTREIEKVLPNIANDLIMVLKNGSPATLTFSIKPPNRSRQSYLQTITNQITPIVSKYFPDYSISIKTSAQKSLLGFLSDIVLTITIQPSVAVVSNQKTIDFSLVLPGSSISKLANKAIPGLVSTVQSVINSGQPYVLSINIKPPFGSTQSYLTKVTNELVPIISGFFPNYQLDVKTSAQKGILGVLTNIVITVTITGSSGGGVSVPSGGVNVDLDLSVRGSSVISQVNQILPSVLNNLMSYLNGQQTAALNFKIKPPRNSRVSFVKTTVNSIVPIIAKMFPKYKIHIKSDANQNEKGFVTEVLIVISIYPL